MRAFRWILTFAMIVSSIGCSFIPRKAPWQEAVERQVAQLGYRNWIIVTEASFPAHNKPGFRHVTADIDVPEGVDYVLRTLEQTEHVRPRVYLPREQRSVENEFAPGIDEMRKRIKESLHGHEFTELDQQSLITLLESANKSFDILVIRTHTALPYSSVFLELQPGYWDNESEARLRSRIESERMQKLSRPFP
jgi:hypothetical protein